MAAQEVWDHSPVVRKKENGEVHTKTAGSLRGSLKDLGLSASPVCIGCLLTSACFPAVWQKSVSWHSTHRVFVSG